MFFTRKERCKYCAGELKDDKCTNSNCIAYVKENTESTEQEEKTITKK